MKKQSLLTISALMLTACGTANLAVMEKSADISAQPELQIKTDGDFWGFGKQGTFDLAGLYKGKYNRNASDANWFFGRITVKDGSMAAEIVRNDNGTSWQLVCTGGGASVNYMGVDFGGNDPYRCDVLKGETVIGEYKMEPTGGLIKLGIEKKEKGYIRVGSTHFNVETIHTSKDLMMATEMALGYSFKQGSQEVAAAQTNGYLTLQMLPELTEEQKDVLVIGTIASSLSWRPEE